MPLVRYELRSEYELANRELYRSAPKNDPEAILEGVSMVSLVGIVRQLGDLAEFAADVFHELHEAVMATASRSHDLVARVSQLEGELPALEKAIQSRKTNPLQFAYAPGLEWHASNRNDQNLCTQGDLPRFIRSSYEECRGPPRLFLLDKFDVGGVGACLKRYTDPSFFKMEWASSEIMKAEKAQQDKKARRSKKPRRRKEGDAKDSRPTPVQFQQPRARYSTISVSSVDGLSESATTPLTNMAVESEQSSKPFPFVTFLGGSQQSSKESTLSLSAKSPMSVRKTDSKNAAAADKEKEEQALKENSGQKIVTDAATKKEEKVDDAASDTEQFLDAMTTMESETDSEPREKRRLSNFRQSKVVDVKKPENGEDARFEDARNLAMDSETEAESKYSLDLTPISVEPRAPVHHENVQLDYRGMDVENDSKMDADTPTQVAERPLNISEDLRLEYEDRDVTDDEGEYPEKDLPPEGDDLMLEYPEEDDFEVESRTREDLRLEDEERKLLELHQDRSGLIEDVPGKAASHTSLERAVDEETDEEAALKDYIEESPDDEGAALESMQSSDAEEVEKAEETVKRKNASELEDEEPFDVEVIQVIGDNGDTKKEVEFEPLLASDDEATIEAQTTGKEMKGEDAADSENIDNREPDFRLPETKANVHDTAETSDALRETETVCREEPANIPVREDEAEILREKSVEVYPATEVAKQAGSGDNGDSNAQETLQVVDEAEQPIIGLESVQTKEAVVLERNESPVDVFESASSQENFFNEEMSSAFSDENNARNDELEVFSLHDGYSGDDDSTRNGHSEATSELLWTPAGSVVPSGDENLDTHQQPLEPERDLNEDGKEPDKREGFTLDDVNQQLLSRTPDQSEQLHEDEEVHSRDILFSNRKAQGNEVGEQQHQDELVHSQDVLSSDCKAQENEVDDQQQFEDELVHSRAVLSSDSKAQENEVGHHKADDDKAAALDHQTDKKDIKELQLRAESTIFSDPQLEEIERPTSRQDSPKMPVFDDDAIWRLQSAEDNTSEKSEESLSSSPRSPVFSALSPAKSADSLESEVATLLSPSSPTYVSTPSPVSQEMPPLPPLPPLRWRTSLFMTKDSGLNQPEPPSLKASDGDLIATQPVPQALVESETLQVQAIESIAAAESLDVEDFPQPETLVDSQREPPSLKVSDDNLIATQPLPQVLVESETSRESSATAEPLDVEDTIDRDFPQPETLVDKPLPELSDRDFPRPETLVDKPLPELSNRDFPRPETLVDKPLPELPDRDFPQPETSVDKPLPELSEGLERFFTAGKEFSLLLPDSEPPSRLSSVGNDLLDVDKLEQLPSSQSLAGKDTISQDAPADGIPVSTMDDFREEFASPPAAQPSGPETSPRTASLTVADAPPSPLVTDSQPLAATGLSHPDHKTLPDATVLHESSVPPPADDTELPTIAPAREDLSQPDDSQPLPVSTMELSVSPPSSPLKEQLPDPGPAETLGLPEASLPPQSHSPTAADDSPRASTTPGTIDDLREVSVPPRSPSPAKDFPDASSPAQAEAEAQAQASSPARTEVSIPCPATSPLEGMESSTAASRDSPEALASHVVGEGRQSRSMDPPEVLESPRPADDSPAPPPLLQRNLDEEPGTFPADAPSSARKDLPDDALIQAISVHDRTKLKRVPSDHPGAPKAPDEREVLLEQIRSQSFNLRHTIVEKKETKETTPRLVTNINVAAILEKANAIRQSLADSEDEDDDWSE